MISETDGLDKSGTTSREADKVTQLEARTRAYGSRKRIYLECTVSTQEGRTWQEYQNGTTSRIALCCPHCQSWVSPERQHLKGWREATSQAEARTNGNFVCEDCGQLWNETERRAANLNSQLLHEGQQINEQGTITGDPKATETLGFRWSAVHNLFLTAGDLAADEWKASRSSDEESVEREMRQFVWCLPVLPNRWEETAIQAEAICKRVSVWPRAVVPAGTAYVTCAMDLGKYLCHWVMIAWQENVRCQIIDYGRIEVASEELGIEPALMLAMQEFADPVQTGYPVGIDPDDPTRVAAEPIIPAAAWIDAGYMTETVYKFCRNTPGFMPAVGRGATQIASPQEKFKASRKTNTRRVGEGYFLNRLPDKRVTLVEINADHWKSWVHQRLTTPSGQRVAMQIFQAPPHEHLSLAKHLTAERKIEEFISGKGVVTRWERIRRNNHWFDALYNACAAGHLAGIRLCEGETRSRRPHMTLAELRADTREKKSFIDRDRWQQSWRGGR